MCRPCMRKCAISKQVQTVHGLRAESCTGTGAGFHLLPVMPLAHVPAGLGHRATTSGAYLFKQGARRSPARLETMPCIMAARYERSRV